MAPRRRKNQFLPKSLRVLDFDHTIAFTGELVYVISPEGDVVESLTSDEYSHHELTRDEVLSGYTYDFSEFDDVDVKSARENEHVVKILRNFISAPSDRIVLILTARSQVSESGIRRYLNSLEIDNSKVAVVGVGTSDPEKKVAVVREILEKYDTINQVSFFDDSGANTDSMTRFLSSFKRVNGSSISFDVAKVDESGKLVRLPGYRSNRREDVKSRR